MGDKASFKFDLNRITYREIIGFSKGDTSTQTEDVIQLLARVLVEWSFEAPITPENIENLGVVDFMRLQKAFNAEMNKVLEEGKN